MNKLLLLMVFMLLLVVPAVFSITYNDAVITGDLVDFEFCFNPDLEKEFYKENFVPYVDVVSGCDIIEQRVVAKLPVKLTSTVYWNETTCLWKDDKTQPKDLINNTSPQIEVCTTVTKSKTTSEDIIEVFDLKETDILFQKDMQLCVIAKRKATTENQLCDVNLNIDMNNDGDFTDLSDVRIVEDGFAWWNTTWNKKYLINISSETLNYDTFKLEFNSSNIDMGDCQSDGGDVRFINFDENTSLPFNLSSWNITTGIVYVNSSIASDLAIWLYCDTAGTTTTSSVSLNAITVYENTNDYYKFNNSGSLTSASSTSVLTKTGSPSVDTGIIDNSYDFGAISQKLVNTTTTDLINQSYSFWAKREGNGGVANYGILGASAWSTGWWDISETSSDSFNLGFNAYRGANCNVYSTGYRLPLDGWAFVVVTVDGTAGVVSFYVNGSIVGSKTHADCTGTWKKLTSIGAFDWRGDWFNGDIDEVGYYHDIVLTLDQINALNNSMVQYPFYSEPSYVVGAGESNIVLTDLGVGVYDDWVNNSLVLDEGQDFRIWANYSYDVNGSSVVGGNCSFFADNIVSEDYQQSVNISVCTSGCDSTNQSFTFTDLHNGDGFVDDIIRLKLCKLASNPAKSVFVSTNYSALYTISYPTIPLCSNGYVNITLNDRNSSGATDVLLSVSTNAQFSKRLVLVDGFAGIDRVHNASEELVFNVSSQLWVSEEHEYYEDGSRNITVNCTDGVGVENQSSVLELVINNVAPSIFVDTIWWWSLSSPVEFTPSIQAKYPLVDGINVTGGCQDNDLFNAGVYLNYSNGSNIYSIVFPVSDNQVPSSVNFSQSNFSTNLSYLNGDLEYKFQGWCNDTSNNVSTIIRSFSAVNNKPTALWTSAGGTVGSVPQTYNFTCADDEGESLTAYVFINGSLNTSGDITGFVFDYPEGSYELNVSCADSFRNSTHDSIVVSYTAECVLQVFGLTNGERYRDTSVFVSANCSNGIVLSSCEYGVNNFAVESFDCAGANLTLELGRNLISINVSDGVNSVSEDFQVFAKKTGSSFADYILLFVLFILLVIVIWFSNFVFDAGVSHLFVVGLIGLLGYFCIALSVWVAVVVWVFALFYAVSKLF